MLINFPTLEINVIFRRLRDSPSSLFLNHNFSAAKLSKHVKHLSRSQLVLILFSFLNYTFSAAKHKKVNHLRRSQLLLILFSLLNCTFSATKLLKKVKHLRGSCLSLILFPFLNLSKTFQKM